MHYHFNCYDLNRNTLAELISIYFWCLNKITCFKYKSIGNFRLGKTEDENEDWDKYEFLKLIWMGMKYEIIIDAIGADGY